MTCRRWTPAASPAAILPGQGQAARRQRGTRARRFSGAGKIRIAARSGHRPVDGYYVQFTRLLLRYPELLAWEMLWTNSLRETYAAIYKTVKSAKPALPVGWHIWHNNSFSPIYRAEQDLHDLAAIPTSSRSSSTTTAAASAWPVMSTASVPPFMAVLRTGPARLTITVTGFGVARQPVSRTGLPATTSFVKPNATSPDSPAPTRSSGPASTYIPTEPGNSKCTPQSVNEAVTAALRAGAPGVLLPQILGNAPPRPLPAPAKPSATGAGSNG